MPSGARVLRELQYVSKCPSTDKQVILIAAPMQAVLFSALIKLNKKHLTALDNRTMSLTGVVRNLHSIKLFAYEPIFAQMIADQRKTEARYARRSITMRASGNIIALCIPAIAAVGMSLM
jgi:hypothetical protein